MRRAQGGFTLLEVLVAFLLLAVVGGALMELFQGGLRRLAITDEYARAGLLARSKLAELEALRLLEPGDREGRFDEEFRYRLTLTPYAGEADSPLPPSRVLPLRATLAVLWGEPPDDHQLTVETLLLTSAGEGESR